MEHFKPRPLELVSRHALESRHELKNGQLTLKKLDNKCEIIIGVKVGS